MKTKEQDTLNPEQDEAQKAERALVLKWQKVIKDAKEAEHMVQYHKSIKRNRRRVAGIKEGNLDSDEKVRTNLVFSTIRAQQARVYAKNPELSIRPSKAVNQKQYGLWKKFGQTAEVVVNRQLTDAHLKKRGKASVRAALTSKIGWLKVTYQRDIKEDPIIVSRINDTQENIRKIEALMCKCQDEDENEEHEVNKAELEILLQALEADVEVTHSEGLVLDRILSEDMLWDPSIPEFDLVTELSGWMAHGLWFNDDSFNETFGRKPGDKADTYSPKDLAKKDDQAEGKQYRVWEIWDRVTNTVYTVCEGDLDFCREPYQVTNTGERWYPFFELALIPLDGAKLPMDGIELLEKLQDEYEETRDKFAKHREANVPHYICDADTGEETIKRKTVAGVGEVVIIDAQGRPLREVFQKAESLSINAADYDTSPIRSDIEWMSGLGDSARGSVAKAKTLGEAQIMENAIAERSDDMTDQIEDWFTDIGKYVLEILLQELTLDQVIRIAGEDAEWPDMPKEMIFDMVNVETRAGSSGKPNKAQEQESWVKFMPQLQKLIEGIASLREAGKDDIAQSMIMIARETIRRFDDRIDIEEFLPQDDEGQPMDDEQKRMAMMEQMEKLKKELEQLDANIRKTNAEAESVEVDTDIKVAGVNEVVNSISALN